MATSGTIWRRSIFAITIAWTAFVLFLMLRARRPAVDSLLPIDAHVLIPAVLTMVVAGLVVATRERPHVAWTAAMVTALAVFLLELAQIAVPTRAFEQNDVLFGLAGVLLGAGVVAALMRLLPAETFLRIVSVGGAASLAVAITITITRDPEVLMARVGDEFERCHPSTTTADSWDLHLIRFESQDGGCVGASSGAFAVFGGRVDIDEGTGVASFEGGGLVSGPLTGLAEALARSDELTFGIRFRSDDLGPATGVSLLGRLNAGVGNRDIAWIHAWNRFVATETVADASYVRVGVIADDVIVDREFHEVVLTYRDGVHRTYVDGRLAGTESGVSFELDTDGEVRLTLGRPFGGTWPPIDAEISHVAIAARVLDDEQIGALFDESER